MSSVAVTLFFGGWLRPFPNVEFLAIPMNYGAPFVLFAGSGLGCFRLVKGLADTSQRYLLMAIAALLVMLGGVFLNPAVNAAVIGLFWFFLKVAVFVYVLIWFRGTFPRFRYDQLMDIGWKLLIPLGMLAILANAVVGMAF